VARPGGIFKEHSCGEGEESVGVGEGEEESIEAF
jgi:hypothetical protein